MIRQMPYEPVPASVLFMVDLAASSRMTLFVRSCSVMPEHGFYELLRRPFPPPPPAGSARHHHLPVDQQARGSLPARRKEWGGDARKERGNGQSTPLPSVLVQEGSRKFRPWQKGGAFSKICQDSSHEPFPKISFESLLDIFVRLAGRQGG